MDVKEVEREEEARERARWRVRLQGLVGCFIVVPVALILLLVVSVTARYWYAKWTYRPPVERPSVPKPI